MEKKKNNVSISRGEWATMQYALSAYIQHCQTMIHTDPVGAAGWAMSGAEGRMLKDKLTALGQKEGWVK